MVCIGLSTDQFQNGVIIIIIPFEIAQPTREQTYPACLMIPIPRDLQTARSSFNGSIILGGSARLEGTWGIKLNATGNSSFLSKT